jgi:hypothetical protein
MYLKNLKSLLNLFLLIILFTSYSCTEKCSPISLHNCSDNFVKGSGYLVSETRNFNQFRSVHIATAGIVNLTQSDTQEVKITVDDNLMEYVRLSVTNNTLVIDIEPGYSLNNMHLTVHINLPVLEELNTSSAGKFVSQNTFNCNELRLFSSSAGNIFLNIDANYIYTNLSSAGNANLSGTASIHNAIVSSAGGLHAFSLITDTTTINLSSAGNAEVYVNDLLNANLSSAGSLYYKGDPIINAIVSSLGMIINAN